MVNLQPDPPGPAHELKSWEVELLRLFAPDDCDALSWSAPDDGGVRFIIWCSDTFDYATADREEVTATDLALLVQAKTDLPKGDWPALWVSRKRGLRPMLPWLERTQADERKLFEAAGPPSE